MARTVATILSLSILFHLLVLSGAIDYRIVWGGRLESIGDMVVFELASIALNGLFLAIVLHKTRSLRIIRNQKFVNGILWVMAGVFLLNTFGNLTAVSSLETQIFTPLTILLCAGCVIMALDKKS